MTKTIGMLAVFLLITFTLEVLSQTCNNEHETVPVKQPDGSYVCECDRSNGYIGQTEYTCWFIDCPENMQPDDDEICYCTGDYYKRDEVCVAKSRCKPDEILIHNGSRYDDRKCGQISPVNIRRPPVVLISDIKSTSATLVVFRNGNDTGVQNVTLTYSNSNDMQQHRVIRTKIGDKETKVSVTITKLSSNTSYQLEIFTSDQRGTSDQFGVVVHTEHQVTPRAAPDVKVLKVDIDSCTLEVTPDKELHSGKIALNYRNLTDNREGSMEKTIKEDKKVTVMQVTGLIANTTYEVEVKTDDGAGLSDSTQFQIQTPAEQNPGAPSAVGESNQTILVVACTVGVIILVAIAVGVLLWRKFRPPKKPQRREQYPIQETGAGNPSEGLTRNLLEVAMEAQASESTPLKDVVGAEATEDTPIKVVVEDPIVCHPESEL